MATDDNDSDEVLALEVGGGGRLWTVPNLDADALLVTDVTGDVTPEVIIGESFGPVLLLDGRTGAQIASIDNPGTNIYAVAVGDLDGDCVSEVAWTTDGSGLRHLKASSCSKAMSRYTSSCSRM